MTDDEKRNEESGDTGETNEMRSDPPTEKGDDQTRPPGRARRLLRSRDDRVIAGVGGGLGRYFDIDPVIVRIGFAVSILFGGLGIVAYIAAMLFVPSDDGAGNPAPSSRGRGIARAAGIGLLALVAVGGFGALVATAAFVTGIGYGLGVVAMIVVIGMSLIVLSFSGGAKWLIVPAAALTIGVGVAAAADLDLEGGIGTRDYAPTSAMAIPDGGYDLGVGRLAVDLRDIDWSQDRILDLDLRLGAGDAIVAVPADVCVVADVHVDAGNLQIAGQQSDGWDVDTTVGEGSSATPRLMLDADLGMGQLRVINDDTIDITEDRNDLRHTSGGDPVAREANAKACAG